MCLDGFDAIQTCRKKNAFRREFKDFDEIESWETAFKEISWLPLRSMSPLEYAELR